MDGRPEGEIGPGNDEGLGKRKNPAALETRDGEVGVLPIDLDDNCESMLKILDFLHYFKIEFTTEEHYGTKVVEMIYLKHNKANTRIEITEFKRTKFGGLKASVAEIFEPPPFVSAFSSFTTNHNFVTGTELVAALLKVGVVVDTKIVQDPAVSRPVYVTRSTRSSFTLDLKYLGMRIDELL